MFIHHTTSHLCFQINGSDLTNVWHEEAVKLLKQFEPDTDIVMVLYREDVYYTQPPIPAQENGEQQNGQISVNTNSNNSVGTKTGPLPPQIHFPDQEMIDNKSEFVTEV